MPYFYLYDSYLQERTYANQLIRLENTLTDLGIQGKIGKLTLLKSVREIIEAAMRDGADTVVAVGNDITISRVAEVIAQESNITLGIIPLGQEHQTIAELLGIPQGVLACHVLSGRIIEKLSLGLINNQYFIRSAALSGTPNLICEKPPHQYQLKLDSPHTIKICNLDWCDDGNKMANPQNDLLETVLQPLSTKRWVIFNKKNLPPSFLQLASLQITAEKEEIPIIVDEYKTFKTPALISIAKEHLRVIVGKKRLF